MLPQYKQLYQNLKKAILAGRFEEGDLLPSENSLSAEYALSRMTVRKALDELAREGYIERSQGKGSVVSPIRKTLGLLSFRGFTDVLGEIHQRVETVMISAPELSAWPRPFFYPLSKKEKESGCAGLSRLRMAEDIPVMLEYTWLPAFGVPDLWKTSFVGGSLFETLNVRYQIEVNNLEQELRAISGEPSVCDLLKLPHGSPVLHIYRKYMTNVKDFYFYSSLFCNTQKFTIGNVFKQKVHDLSAGVAMESKFHINKN